MIPIKLTIQGLYSYKDKAEIDFSLLTEAKLFGIFGHVGSGKSTILEAVTFALYGKTDRLNLSGDNRNYNMLNLKSDKLLIDFEFATGSEKTKYRATAKTHRNKKKFEDVKAIERSAYKEHKGEWQAIETVELEEAIGLSYDNFRRTIIIPQGKFQEFLQLGRADRTQMMKELFSLGKYELFYQTTALERKNTESLNNIEGQLQQLGNIEPEQLKQLKEALSNSEKKIAELNNQYEILNKAKQTLDELKELFLRKIQLDTEQKKLEAIKPEILATEKTLIDYENANRLFKSLLTTKNNLKQESKRYNDLLKVNKTKKEELNKEVKAVTLELEKLKPEVDKKDEINKKIEELKSIIKILAINKQLETTQKQLKENKTRSEKFIDEKSKITNQIELANKELKKLKTTTPDSSLLYKIREWHLHNKQLAKSLEIENNKLKVEENSRLQLLNKLSDLYQNDLFEKMPLNQDPEKGIDWLLEIKSGNKKLLSNLNNKKDQLIIKTKLEEYAHALHDGEPCPLCGSKSHPGILNIENVGKDLEETKKSIQETESLNNHIQDTTNTLSNLLVQLKKYDEDITKIKSGFLDLNEEIKKHNNKFIWDNYRNEKELDQAISNVEKAQLTIKKSETEIERLRKESEKAEQQYKVFEDNVRKLEQETAGKESEKNTWLGQLRLLNFNDYSKFTPDDLKTKMLNREKALANLLKKHEELTEQSTQIQKAENHLAGKIDADNNSLKEIDIKLQEVTIDIGEQLKSSPWDTIQKVENIFALNINIETERKKIDDYKLSSATNKTRLEELSEKIAKREYKEEEHLKLQEELQKINTDIKENNQILGETRNKITTLEKAITSQKELMQKKEALKLRAEDIKVMKSLFKSSGFVDYISSVYLENLCQSANERFRKMTRQQLSLELSENNIFQVRDFMNGGKIRSVKTLSGGQTFQASLALALALADNIQKTGTTNENFFFLDEGFGSLDKESLGIVFETLKSLRKENRIVGVISHVEELQQEIPNYILIKNDEENGSNVKTSWNS